MLKRVGELATIALNPQAAAAMWNRQPMVIPREANAPALNPFWMLLVATKIMSLPGVMLSIRDARAKSRSEGAEIIKRV